MKPLHQQPSLSLFAKLCAAGALAAICLAAQATPKVIKKVPPEFPREAAMQSITSGVIKAKMNIDGEGKVTEVTILEAEPRRVFDRAVTRALLDWRFEPSGEKQTHEVKLVFRNDD